MKISYVQFISALLVAAVIGFFIGRSFAPAVKTTNASAKKVEAKVVAANKTDEVKPELVSEKKSEATPEKETDEVVAVVDPKPEEANTEVIKPEGSNPGETNPEKTERQDMTTLPLNVNNANRILPPVTMGISDQKISSVLETISENLEKKRLPYISSLSQDCSGIFHQIKDSLQARLVALRTSAEYHYPKYKKDRNSRQIADWYWENDNLMIVEDAVASRNSIRPGAVMFFGKSNKKYKNMTIEQLTDKNNNYTSNGIIGHVAVVTSVKTDEDNNVIEYTMMHGRNPRRHASRTGSKEVQSKRTKGLPPFGNWSQQWVAIANIVTPKQ
jgi:hypothetical protein